jgi:hypothetical protein
MGLLEFVLRQVIISQSYTGLNYLISSKNAAKVILYNLIPKTKFSIYKKSVLGHYLNEGLSAALIIQKPP